MAKITFDEVEVGHELPDLALPPITRTALALFAGASGDHNSVHLDPDVAREAGLDDVIVHGMLLMAYIGRLLTNWVPQQALRGFSNRFTALTNLGDSITCTGKVVEKLETNDEKLVRLDVSAADQNGNVKLSGQALVALD